MNGGSSVVGCAGSSSECRVCCSSLHQSLFCAEVTPEVTAVPITLICLSPKGTVKDLQSVESKNVERSPVFSSGVYLCNAKEHKMVALSE